MQLARLILHEHFQTSSHRALQPLPQSTDKNGYCFEHPEITRISESNLTKNVPMPLLLSQGKIDKINQRVEIVEREKFFVDSTGKIIKILAAEV